jgi:organic radical activating enzyme
MYSWNDGVEVSFEQILVEFEKSKMSTMTITGGEPLVQMKELRKFMKLVSAPIYIETNGTITPLELHDQRNVYFNVSPKLSNSGMEHVVNKVALQSFIDSGRTKCFKFVVGSSNDIDEAIELCNSLCMHKVPIVFQPMGQLEYNKEKLQLLWEYIVSLEKDVRFIPQFHTIVYGRKRGV